MRVLVTGPESSGGRFMARWLGSHPDLDVAHWSMPHGAAEWKHWPTDHDFGSGPDLPQFVVLMTRELRSMVESQVANHGLTCCEAEASIPVAYLRSLSWALSRGIPVRMTSYELVVAGSEMSDVFRWLGVDPVDCPEPIVDGNLKWSQR